MGQRECNTIPSRVLYTLSGVGSVRVCVYVDANTNICEGESAHATAAAKAQYMKMRKATDAPRVEFLMRPKL